MDPIPRIVAVAADPTYTFSKTPAEHVELLTGLGVRGDAHAGETVKHRSRVARDPTQPNLRQIHLIHSELFDELAPRGFRVAAGDLGENLTTRGLALLDLPEGTVLRIGRTSICLTGLRNPCAQIDRFQPGLMAAVLDRAPDGALIRKAGVMAVVTEGGVVRVGDAIQVVRPVPPHRALQPV